MKNPSGAAMTIMGRTANGWKEWKSKFGETLDKLKRHAPDRASNDDSEDESKARWSLK